MLLDDAGNFILNKLLKELPAHLSYHNVDHTRDVYEAAKRIGELEQIPDDEMNLLLTAALFHDSGFLMKAKGHEEESCRIAQRELPAFDYKPGEIDRICCIIMATKLPQSPACHLEKILADADLDYLGRDDFFNISDKLYRENEFTGLVCNQQDWNRSQVEFIENHQYFTNTAINLRQAKKEANLEQIKAHLNTATK
jgi:uncharacterized protein